jgi:hypothetical protein
MANHSGISHGSTSINRTECDVHHSTFEWTSGIACTVDLEGIADDGYGYTVKITALGRRKQAPSNYMWRVPKFNFRGTRRATSEEVEPKYAQAISLMTEVNVAETWKAPVERVSSGTDTMPVR